MTILIIDDEPSIRNGVSHFLVACGWATRTAATAAEAIELMRTFPVEVVLLDLNLPDRSGLEILSELKRLQPDAAVIILTGEDSVQTAVKAMKLGGDHYMTKPPSFDELQHRIQDLLNLQALRKEAAFYRTRGQTLLIGNSPPMMALRKLIGLVAESEGTTVFIKGESGTGKELVAREIHARSSQSDRPFIDVNCASLSPTLLESELFGHERGAFTDAKLRKTGLLEVAAGGTLFLDEIGEMDPGNQAKFLRVLESRKFRRVGGTTDLTADFRLISATNRDLAKMVSEGRFREDLFYRLNVFPVTPPTLREHAADIPLLVEYYTQTLGTARHGNKPHVSEAAMAVLQSYPWPGNVRELRNVLERALILSHDGEIRPEHLPAELTPAGPRAPLRHGVLNLEMVEKNHIQAVLELAQGNITQAAKSLGISRSTMKLKIRKYGIQMTGLPPLTS